MDYKAGPHFLQIPGPSNVPGRILRAIERPTIDHRGPTFQALGLTRCQPAILVIRPIICPIT